MLNKQRLQRYYKVIVYFKGGTKTYNLSIVKYKDFMIKLKLRKDVLKYVVENTYKYIY